MTTLPANNATTELPIPTPFPTPAELTADCQDAVTVSETTVRTATPELTPDNAKTAESFAETESWRLVRNVTTEFTTVTQFQMLAEPTASSGLAAMESSMLWKNAMTEETMPTDLMPADPGAAFPSVVTESSTLDVVKLAMTATSSMVMDVHAHAKRNVVTDELTLESNATMDHATTIPDQLAAEPTADCLDAVMVSLTLERSVTMLDKTLLDQTTADQTAHCPNAEMVSLTICMASFATKEDVTL